MPCVRLLNVSGKAIIIAVSPDIRYLFGNVVLGTVICKGFLRERRRSDLHAGNDKFRARSVALFKSFEVGDYTVFLVLPIRCKDAVIAGTPIPLAFLYKRCDIGVVSVRRVAFPALIFIDKLGGNAFIGKSEGCRRLIFLHILLVGDVRPAFGRDGKLLVVRRGDLPVEDINFRRAVLPDVVAGVGEREGHFVIARVDFRIIGNAISVLPAVACKAVMVFDRRRLPLPGVRNGRRALLQRGKFDLARGDGEGMFVCVRDGCIVFEPADGDSHRIGARLRGKRAAVIRRRAFCIFIGISDGGAVGGHSAFYRGSEGEAGGFFACIFIRPLFFYVKADARKGRLRDLPCIGEGDNGRLVFSPLPFNFSTGRKRTCYPSIALI